MAEECVLSVTAQDHAGARRLLGRLKSATAVEVRAAAVVRRSGEGDLHVTDRFGDDPPPPWPQTASRHSVASGILGVLAASIDAIFLGNAAMALLGAVAAPDPAEVVELIARDVPRGGTALVALVAEAEAGAAEAVTGGAAVTRWSADQLRAAWDGR